MKVFLTGATGFIGSHVARRAAGAGWDVHCMARPGADRWRLADVPSLQWVEADLLKPQSLATWFARERPDVCLHLAWPLVRGDQLLGQDHLWALQGSLSLALLAADGGCKRFVGIGSVFEHDTAGGFLGERSPKKPANLYAACKVALQTVLSALATGPMKTTWVRVFYLFGPYEDERRIVPSVIRSLLNGQEARTTAGEQVVDFLHVRDVAEAVFAVAASDAIGEFNVGSGRPVPLRNMVETIATIVGRPDLVRVGVLPYRSGEPMFLAADTSRMTEITGWRPSMTLVEGLNDTVTWWRNRRQTDGVR